MVKLGKHKNCVKSLKRFGLSQKLAEIACARYLVGDDEWSAEKKKKPKTGFEVEEEKPEEEKEKEKARAKKIQATWKERTAAGGKGAGLIEPEKTRPIVSGPLTAQMPLFQPWRSVKSQHRLQTKLEKLQTAEQKYLTQEQLEKRAQYALTIKKRDSGDLEITLPAIILDDLEDAGRKPLGRSGSGRRMKQKGEKQEQWITTKTGQAVKITEPEGKKGAPQEQQPKPIDVMHLLGKILSERGKGFKPEKQKGKLPIVERVLRQSEKEVGKVGKAAKHKELTPETMSPKRLAEVKRRFIAIEKATELPVLKIAAAGEPVTWEEKQAKARAIRRMKRLGVAKEEIAKYAKEVAEIEEMEYKKEIGVKTGGLYGKPVDVRKIIEKAKAEKSLGERHREQIKQAERKSTSEKIKRLESGREALLSTKPSNIEEWSQEDVNKLKKRDKELKDLYEKMKKI